MSSLLEERSQEDSNTLSLGRFLPDKVVTRLGVILKSAIAREDLDLCALTTGIHQINDVDMGLLQYLIRQN